MSVKINGKLTIKYRNGRNGKFPVGELVTSIGSFTVKDKALEQYSEGTYNGEFVIGNIAQASYAYNGSITMYMLAKLDDFNIGEYSTGKVVEPAPIEPDPADEEPAIPTTHAAKPINESNVDSDTGEIVGDVDADLTLFGAELYPLVANNASEVKLDPSVGRTILRTQADRMKQLGYRFEASQQIWIKK
jgi:hypothetical protein